MGCLPTYDQIGTAAPVCLIIARALQGLSVGGQLVGTFAFSVESAPEGKKCIFGTLVGAGAGQAAGQRASAACVIGRSSRKRD